MKNSKLFKIKNKYKSGEEFLIKLKYCNEGIMFYNLSSKILKSSTYIVKDTDITTLNIGKSGVVQYFNITLKSKIDNSFYFLTQQRKKMFKMFSTSLIKEEVVSFLDESGDVYLIIKISEIR